MNFSQYLNLTDWNRESADMEMKNLHKNIYEQLDSIRATVYPDRCHFCGKVVEHKVTVCDSCKKQVKIIRGARCLSCGNMKKDCKCKGRSNFYNGIAAPFRYEGVVRSGISLWKFRGAERNVNFFANMVAAAIKDTYGDLKFDVITFIPQTKKESEEREYNQGEQLALAVGEKINTPVLPLLVKIYETKRQHNLPLISRSGNVFGVFECCNKAQTEGKNILLVDDIKTSGSTLNECAKMLRIYGASSVYCAVIAVV